MTTKQVPVEKNQKPSTFLGVARSQVNAWLGGCSEPTRKSLSGHELMALRQLVVACMEISREQPELE